jgi:4-amino-4-deoxy-L-arabinose transferase-like glycosyltransferase
MAGRTTGVSPTPSLPSVGGLQMFALIFTAIFLLHAPLLRLPYFWDEAGYYIPAAYDFFQHGELVPHSTLSNAHPPLPSIYLAMWWELSAFKPAVTRIAMLLIAALALVAVYRLARFLSNVPVAIATLLCTAIFPVWFAQSSLAHADLAAAALTLWGLLYYFEAKDSPGRKHWVAVLLFALAGLAKETAIITPLALACWDVSMALRRRGDTGSMRDELWRAGFLLVSLVPVALWFLYYHHRTGYFFGNPEYFRYNVGSTLTPARVLLSFVRRIWQLLGYMGMLLLTLLTVYAMSLPPLKDDGVERERISLAAQYRMGIVILAHMLMFSLLGGAVLARYLLPAYPLPILIWVSTLRRRLRWWKAGIAVVLVVFAVFLFDDSINASPPEDNLQYRDFVVMHKHAANYLSQHYATVPVLTAWPATDELRLPYLGYVNRPVRTVAIDNFAAENLVSIAQQPQTYAAVLIFSTKHYPRYEIRWNFWEKVSGKYYDYHRDLSADAAAQLLGGTVVWREEKRDQFAAIIDMQRSELAQVKD